VAKWGVPSAYSPGITAGAPRLGIFAVLRANRTIEDALQAPDLDDEDTVTESEPEQEQDLSELPAETKSVERA
jgi:hypothetical protein